MTSRQPYRLVLILAGALYTLWGGLFILRSSYLAIDGLRYFGLFDDAMISMRYAWSLAHGLGLVWNAGERVEGYSNLLMTLLMALPSVVFEKRFAVLAIQIFGIPTMLATAWLTWRLGLVLAHQESHARLAALLAAAAVLLYYPLSFWTLMGMETGLATLLLLACTLLGMRWVNQGCPMDLVGMGILAGLAFLTRNDTLIFTGLVFAYAAIAGPPTRKDPHRTLHLLYAVGIFGMLALAQVIFRYVYYGTVLPNTYVLKLENFPIYIRLVGGTRFVLDFFRETWPILILAAVGLFWKRRGPHILLGSFMLSALGYQIYVGGEPWDLWRMLVPAMPAVFILAALAAVAIAGQISTRLARRPVLPVLSSILMLAILVLADLRFLPNMVMLGPEAEVMSNRAHTNAAIAINALTVPEASVGVIWAGTLPYYTDLYAIDYLGKSDPYIARLPADISGDAGWGSLISVPGHNKYDLEYSIVQRKPTFSQGYAWGYATVRPYFVENYVRVEYHGPIGTKSLFLLAGSPLVCWEACKDEYSIIPWPR